VDDKTNGRKMFLWRWAPASGGSGKSNYGSLIPNWRLDRAIPFYTRLNQLLDREKFDEFAKAACAAFYADQNGRPSLPPGTYFRWLLIGYFEGIDSERGIAWRAADSLGLRQFLRIGLDEDTPDHSTISRTRRLLDVETHRKVFLWVLDSPPFVNRKIALNFGR
jgi:Transposase domain (DUF772)